MFVFLLYFIESVASCLIHITKLVSFSRPLIWYAGFFQNQLILNHFSIRNHTRTCIFNLAGLLLWNSIFTFSNGYNAVKCLLQKTLYHWASIFANIWCKDGRKNFSLDVNGMLWNFINWKSYFSDFFFHFLS